MPKTSKNSFQKVCFSALSLVAAQSLQSEWRSGGSRSMRWALLRPLPMSLADAERVAVRGVDGGESPIYYIETAPARSSLPPVPETV